jgi:hypothetical protein
MRGLFVILACAGCVERALPLPELTDGAVPVDAARDSAGPPDAELKPVGAQCRVDAECQSQRCVDAFCNCGHTICGGDCVVLDSDGANCGACGHSCGGDACAGGACQPTVVLDGQVAPYALAVDEQFVYLRTEDDRVSRVPAHGGASTTLASASGGDVAVGGAFVYYTDHNGGAVYKVPKGGGAPTQLASNRPRPWTLTVDAASVYWIELYDGAIMKVPLGGGAPATIYRPGNNGAGYHNTLASDGSSLYFLYEEGLVSRLPTVGGKPTSLTSEIVTGGQFALCDGSVFAMDYGPGHNFLLERIPAAGGMSDDVAGGQPHPFGGIACDHTRVYFTVADDFYGDVRSAPAGDGPATVLAQNQHAPSAIAVNSTFVFWVEEDRQRLGRLWRIAK